MPIAAHISGNSCVNFTPGGGRRLSQGVHSGSCEWTSVKGEVEQFKPAALGWTPRETTDATTGFRCR